MWPDGWIIFQYLTIYINENLPNYIQNLPKGRNFARSGHTESTTLMENISHQLVDVVKNGSALASIVKSRQANWWHHIPAHSRSK